MQNDGSRAAKAAQGLPGNCIRVCKSLQVGYCEAMRDHYSAPARARILEFLGGRTPGTITCHYITAGNCDTAHHENPPSPVEHLPRFFAEGKEIGRSCWDREMLLADLDIEYVNYDFPAEAFLDPYRSFHLQEPVTEAALEMLAAHGISPLQLISGRGHHFIWGIDRASSAFERLALLGQVSPSLAAHYAQPAPPAGEVVDPKLGRAYAGLSRVMEFVAHHIKRTAAPRCKVPVELTAVLVGPVERGREMISIDLSEYGDPLTIRTVRVPFSPYFKANQQRGVLGAEICANLPPLFCLPMQGLELTEALELMRRPEEVSAHAQTGTTRIPDQSAATERLLDAYQESHLRRFHDWYYLEAPHGPEKWPETYDRTPMGPLPACARYILEHPNDLLLQPSGIERVVRVLLSLGHHPRHIAGLIQSKYDRDFDWGGQWHGYDPASRADFYTRLFTGLFVTGTDDLIAFNSQSAREHKLLPDEHCSDNLEPYRQSLLERRKHERLAHRPFNRLFLPGEHL